MSDELKQCDWECISVGMYESLMKCRTCGREHMESMDAPETYVHDGDCKFGTPPHDEGDV